MKKINFIKDIEGTEFPAGRRTRVGVGVDSSLQAEHFVQGLVMIHPGGSIPAHNHETEETYTILSGAGEMTIDGETLYVEKNDLVYIAPNQIHGLKNIGDSELEMMFVYAPKMVVSHWAEEKSGKLK